MSKATDEWYTPEEILDAVEDYFGEMIGLDPTCSPDAPAWARALHKFTKEDDALSFESWPERGPLFLNMPYSNPPPYVALAIQYALRGFHDPGARGVLLTNASTSTRWGQDLMEAADFACFASPRIRFLRARKSPEDFGPKPLEPLPLSIHEEREDRFRRRKRREKWKKAVEAEAAMETVYVGPRGIELVQPGSPRYENLITGFGGSFADFERAFGAFGYCTELS